MPGIIQGFYALFYVWRSENFSGPKTPEHIPKSSPYTRKKIRGLTTHQYQPGEYSHHDESDFARFFQITPPYPTYKPDLIVQKICSKIRKSAKSDPLGSVFVNTATNKVVKSIWIILVYT